MRARRSAALGRRAPAVAAHDALCDRSPAVGTTTRELFASRALVEVCRAPETPVQSGQFSALSSHVTRGSSSEPDAAALELALPAGVAIDAACEVAHDFTTAGLHDVTLRAADADGFGCIRAAVERVDVQWEGQAPPGCRRRPGSTHHFMFAS